MIKTFKGASQLLFYFKINAKKFFCFEVFGYIRFRIVNALLAQLVERNFGKVEVFGSIPKLGSKLEKRIRRWHKCWRKFATELLDVGDVKVVKTTEFCNSNRLRGKAAL